MTRHALIKASLLYVVTAGLILAVYFHTDNNSNNSQLAALVALAPEQMPLAESNNRFQLPPLAEPRLKRWLVEPVVGFTQRITKKAFGVFITPATSPVQPDHFTGFHTGVDAEFTDSLQEIPVWAIADGTIVVRKWATGYGGVVAIKHIINGIPVFAVYGHLDPTSFLPADIVEIKAGQKIGVLGDDRSDETDGARKHIHFSIQAGDKLDLRGYVPAKAELAHWLNPLDFYKAE